jgi:Bacterial regulatory protein, Fis family
MHEFTRTLDDILATFERNIIVQTLKDTHGNQRKAAKLLGITRRKIQYKIVKHGIDFRAIKEEYRATEHVMQAWHHFSNLKGDDTREQRLLLP